MKFRQRLKKYYRGTKAFGRVIGETVRHAPTRESEYQKKFQGPQKPGYQFTATGGSEKIPKHRLPKRDSFGHFLSKSGLRVPKMDHFGSSKHARMIGNIPVSSVSGVGGTGAVNLQYGGVNIAVSPIARPKKEMAKGEKRPRSSGGGILGDNPFTIDPRDFQI